MPKEPMRQLELRLVQAISQTHFHVQGHWRLSTLPKYVVFFTGALETVHARGLPGAKVQRTKRVFL